MRSRARSFQIVRSVIVTLRKRSANPHESCILIKQYKSNYHVVRAVRSIDICINSWSYSVAREIVLISATPPKKTREVVAMQMRYNIGEKEQLPRVQAKGLKPSLFPLITILRSQLAKQPEPCGLQIQNVTLFNVFSAVQ